MEPPKPFITKKEIKKISNFKITNPDEKDNYYLIEIFLENDNLIINMKSFESKIKLIYENIYTFSELLKMHKYFKMFDTLEEIAQNINELQNKNLISIKKNQNDNYDFILNVELNKTNIELKFELIYKDNNQLIQITEILHSLEKENKELKQSLIEYKTKLEKNELILTQLLKLHKMNSSIMIEIEEFELVVNQIEKNMNKKVNYLKQLYKGTRDGDGMSNISQRAFNINHIVLLVRSKSGYRYGGFTSICFELTSGNTTYKSDDKSFLFYLDRKDTYPIINKDQAIRLCHDRAFMFGPNDIWVYGTFLSNSEGGYTGQATYDYKGLDAALSGINKQYFALQDVEAYQVIYEN